MADFSQIRIDSINRVQRPGTKLLLVNMIIFLNMSFLYTGGPLRGELRALFEKKLRKKEHQKSKFSKKVVLLKPPVYEFFKYNSYRRG